MTTRRIRATRAAVYRALLDAQAVATWRVPIGMTSEVHEFDPRVGGSFRVSLTHDTADAVGKSAAHTDTYHGRFAGLIPDTQDIEVLEGETTDPLLRGEMTITTTLKESDGGTEVVIVHEGIPLGVSLRDNGIGTEMALAALASLVEQQ